MRPAITLLLGLGLLAGGCDRQDGGAEQANSVVPANTVAAAPASPATPAAPGADNAIGMLDRSHKGEAAPDFAFADAKGVKTTLAAFAGKPVLLNLWATWCAPCVKEMPTLDALAQREGAALKVLTISQDLDGPAKVVPYFEKAGFEALEPWTDPDLRFSVGLGANLPTTILYDAAGKEVWRMTGSMDWSNDAARQLIAEASAA
ncbi:TlpA family protein disulfide reductase [Sphingomonas qomolangmaensis]|uniref:TlpA family protein disulfide reductase n=1 Tax=Sphingomonas qomolangmaensis TaxID=2918765 RepID=UPI0029E80E29|nr:TlpA disulfide reductase family protein [Sphingomonas qomolangmaensis]